MRKLSEINEGFMTRSLNRNKSGEERLGNRINSNINELESVDLDLDFLIADKDLEVDGKTLFTWDELLKLEKYVKSNGWRIPTRTELDCDGGVNDPEKIEYMYSQPKDMYLISIKDSKKDLIIKMDDWYGHEFWCIGDDPTRWKISNGRLVQTSIFSEVGGDDKFHIRLVKDKNMNEGFMTRSLNRKKSDEARLENKLQTNISEMDEIDMGNPYLNFADIDLEINGENMFTWEEYLKYKKYIESTGWSLPDVNSLFKYDWYNVGSKTVYTEEELDNGDRIYKGTSKKTGQTLSFLVEDMYLYGRYMIDGKYEPGSYYYKTSVCLWVVGGPVEDFGRKETGSLIKKYKIRLVKYKK